MSQSSPVRDPIHSTRYESASRGPNEEEGEERDRCRAHSLSDSGDNQSEECRRALNRDRVRHGCSCQDSVAPNSLRIRTIRPTRLIVDRQHVDELG